jgi:hypothetical protein
MKANLNELKNADVTFVSLVERGANRIPFRIVKSQDKEQHMIDLTNPGKVLKGATKPEPTAIAGVVVNSTGNAETDAAIVTALTDAGFNVDNVAKNEDGTLTFKQEGDIDPAAVHLVRLSEDMVVVMKGFSPYSADLDQSTDFSEVMACCGFYQGVSIATDALAQTLRNGLYAGSSPADAVKTLKDATGKFTTYVTTLLNGIPQKAFKAESLITEVLKGDKHKKQKPKDGEVDPTKAKDTADAEDKGDAGKTTESTADSAEKPTEKAKAKKDEDGTEATTDAPAAAEPDAAPAATAKSDAPAEAAADPLASFKAEMIEMFGALNQSIGTLTATVTKTAEAQEISSQRLEEVARKADTAANAVSSTVLAPAASADETPAPSVARKSEDPRSGSFDSAFLPGRGRR